MAIYHITQPNEVVVGTAGDDTFILEPSEFAFSFYGSIDGGGGSDTIQLNPATNPLLWTDIDGTQYRVTTYNPTLLAWYNVENFKFNTAPGDYIALSYPEVVYNGWNSIYSTFIGGSGKDEIYVTNHNTTDYHTPDLIFQNWENIQNGIFHKDSVRFYTGGNNGNFYVNGSMGILHTIDVYLSYNQSIFGSNNSDTFWMRPGTGNVYGSGGNDYFGLIYNLYYNPQMAVDGIWDGGAGYDQVTLYGSSTVHGVTLANIEEIYFGDISQGNGSYALSWFSTDNEFLGETPNLHINGQGTLFISTTLSPDFYGDNLHFNNGNGFWLITISGDDRNNILTGTAKGETLSGALGNDTLDGGLGSDTINGGDGDDRVYWDPADSPANISGGNGTDRLVIKDGVATPSLNLAAMGFEIIEIENYDSADSQIWTYKTNAYNLSGQLTDYSFTYDDGTRLVVDLDPEGVAATNQVWSLYFDPNRLDSLDLIYDDGTRTFINMDEDASKSWDQDWLAYDVQSRLSSEDLLNDDGTRTFINLDEDASKNWTQDWFAYDAQGNLSSEDVLYDDGTRTFINIDEAGNQTWTQDWFAYDAQGNLSSEDVFYDNGTRTYINLDEDNSQVWSQSWFTYDNQGRLDTQDVFNDDGTRIFYNYDQDSSQAFTLTAFLYDNTGHAYQQVIAWDDGSTSYVNL